MKVKLLLLGLAVLAVSVVGLPCIGALFALVYGLLFPGPANNLGTPQQGDIQYLLGVLPCAINLVGIIAGIALLVASILVREEKVAPTRPASTSSSPATRTYGSYDDDDDDDDDSPFYVNGYSTAEIAAYEEMTKRPSLLLDLIFGSDDDDD